VINKFFIAFNSKVKLLTRYIIYFVTVTSGARLGVIMDNKDLFVIGAEFKELKYDGFLDWFVRISDLSIHLKNEPTYLISQFAFIFGGLVTFLHAMIRGGRLPYLWLGIVIHGLVIECMCYILPDIDNFWHSQTPIILLGRRLPLHIIFLCKHIGVLKMLDL
jgi:hypothetical protein